MPHDIARRTHHRPAEGLSRAATLAFAAAAGLSVANIYCAQPLLGAMAGDLGISPAAIGLIVTLTQIGYGLGLIFIVPLGDIVDQRRLIVGQGMLSVLALIVIGTAETAGVLLAGAAAMGLLAVVVQVLVARAAALAAPAQRGRVVGTVTSGVVIGILGARVVAGLLADLGGWRAVYLASAGVMLAMVGVLARVLPHDLPPESRDGYVATLRSVPALFLRDRALLARGALALLIFAAFSTFWTAAALPLSAEPFSYSHAEIGLLGLVGMAGALAASGAGRLADRGLGQRATRASLVLLLASWALIMLLPASILLLLAGVVLLDLAVQAVHVTNQSVIFARYPQARSRLVGGYMVFYSIGSATGAIAATVIYAYVGWLGVSALGAAFSAAALLVGLSMAGARHWPQG